MRTTFGVDGLKYEDDRKTVVCKEKGKTYTANNTSGSTVALYKIDGEMITSGARCDYGLCVYNGVKLYLIELKGSDYSHACEQLFETYTKLKSKIDSLGANVYARIVLTRAPNPNLKSHDSHYRKLEKAVGRGNIDMKSIHLQETV